MKLDDSFEMRSTAIAQLVAAADSLIKRYDDNVITCRCATDMDAIDEDILKMREAIAKLKQPKRESDGRSPT